MLAIIAVLTDQDVLLFGLVLFFVLAGLLGYFFYTFLASILVWMQVLIAVCLLGPEEKLPMKKR